MEENATKNNFPLPPKPWGENNNLTINIVSLIIIVAFALLFMYPEKKQKTISEDDNRMEKYTALSQEQLKYLQKISSEPYFNFQVLLSLIEKCRVIEKNFYSNTNKFINNPDNFKLLKDMLLELKLEKGFYRKYMKQTQKYHRQSISFKKRDSLKYYFRVLEDNIDMIKKLLDQFNLNIKIQAKKLL